MYAVCVSTSNGSSSRAMRCHVLRQDADGPSGAFDDAESDMFGVKERLVD